MAMSEMARKARNAYMREYRAKNKERLLKKEKQYREDNSEKIKEYEKEWRRKNPDKVKAAQERYFENLAKRQKMEAR